MRPYRSQGGVGGVIAYDYGADWIKLQFTGGKSYTYKSIGVGAENIKTMKQLADAGRGLTTFVNTHPNVKNGYYR